MTEFSIPGSFVISWKMEDQSFVTYITKLSRYGIVARFEKNIVVLN
jgi:hypothetical protein